MATRDITTAANSAANSRQKALLIFAEFDLPDGFVRVTNAAGDVTWDSKTWRGVGKMGSVDQAREVLNVEAVGMKFSLSGVDQDFIDASMGAAYQGRTARMWLGFIESGAIVADPVLLVVGRMDVMAITDGPVSTVSISTETRLAAWERPLIRRFSDSDQQSEFPGDLGLQYIAEFAAGKEVVWGRG